MKELSIEEKAKAYDEAIERAKEFKEHLLEINDKGYADEMDYIFPELKESEDERIRKALYKAIWTYIPTEEGQEYIAWLEKQGEQKSTDIRTTGYWNVQDVEQKSTWGEEDETYSDHIITAIKSYYTDDKGKENPWREELLRWFKSLKERYTWKPSDEQMIAIQEAMNIVGILTITGSKINSLYQDLKKLKAGKL